MENKSFDSSCWHEVRLVPVIVNKHNVITGLMIFFHKRFSHKLNSLVKSSLVLVKSSLVLIKYSLVLVKSGMYLIFQSRFQVRVQVLYL